ncbi:MAG TPA: glycoside-pentoside-hexuronide (GPH):cation symporter [Eubacteriales bacterium]|nr:glycoside-pentoside-hexuronide (GPH):cation symporter [Eubacteriales bacterium]
MAERVYIRRTSGLKTKEKIGYAMGDVASLMLFSLVTSILQKYYTDVLGISLWSVLILFTITRIWDAVNDPIWGRIIDKRKVGANGRYRPWMLWLSIPLAISAVLMFLKIPGLNAEQYFVYACLTYILFEMLYTGVNIPYGSLASVITTDEKERNSLSVFRSVGSVIGNIPIMLLIVFVKIVPENSGKITLAVGITAALSVLVYYICYRLTRERVPAPEIKREKGETGKIVKNLIKSRPFVSLCVAAMLLLATQMFVQSYYLYLFNSYFNAQWLSTINQVATYLPVAILMFFMGKFAKTVGKKEICAIGMFFASLLNALLFILKTNNPIVFLSLSFLSGIGNTFFFLQVWSLVTDAIDYNEVKTGIRDEATSYAFFTFTRKIGQTIAGVLSLLALISLGYNETWVSDPTSVPLTATTQMYNYAVLIPAVMYLLMALILWFWYPLGKKQLEKLQDEKENSLKELFESKEKNNQ